MGDTPNSGFGRVYKAVMTRDDLSIEAKAIYALLCTYAGEDGFCFPSVSTICGNLDISIRRFEKNLRQLKNAGVVKVERKRSGNILAGNVYWVDHAPRGRILDTDDLDASNLD